jgi:hypothetical protein
MHRSTYKHNKDNFSDNHKEIFFFGVSSRKLLDKQWKIISKFKHGYPFAIFYHLAFNLMGGWVAFNLV